MLRKLMPYLAFIIVLSFSGNAFAAYNPTLTSPSDGYSNAPVDNLNFYWSAADPVDNYRIQISLNSTFTDVHFDYSVPFGTNIRKISGLPGEMTLYWRVIGMKNDTEYPSTSRAFKTGSDGEDSVIYAVNENFNSLAAWTVVNTSLVGTQSAGSNGNVVVARYWSYSNVSGSITSTATVPNTPCTLSYKWAHSGQYASSYPNDALTVSYSTNGGSTWNQIQHLIGSSFNSGWTSTTSPPTTTTSGWKVEKFDVPADALGKSVMLKFYFYSGYGPHCWLDDVQLYYTGKPLEVYSSHGNPNPSGNTYEKGETVTASVESMVFETGVTDSRYACTGWVGTGSVPETGASSSVTFDIYRASTIVWQWAKQYQLIVTSQDNRGVITHTGESWWDSGSSVNVTNSSMYISTGTDGIRWFNNGWVGTGAMPSSGTTLSVDAVMNESATLHFTWVYQYRITIINSAGVGGPTPDVGEHWYSSGDKVTFSVAPFVNLGDGSAYTSIGWRGTGSFSDGDTNTGNATITMVSTLEWKWLAQYYLWVVSEFGRTSGSAPGWYDQDTILSVDCGQYFVESENVRFECRGWQGEGSVFDGIGIETGDFRIIAPTTIEFQWYKQFKVTVQANYGQTNPDGVLWADDGASLGVAALPLTNTSDTRYSWAGWVGTGLPVDPSGGINANFTITNVSVFTATWSVELYVEVSSTTGTFDSDYTGWYPKGTSLDITAIPPATTEGT